MKNDALRLVHSIADPTDRLNVLREYIQALILRSLHESQAFTSIAFVGGAGGVGWNSAPDERSRTQRTFRGKTIS